MSNPKTKPSTSDHQKTASKQTRPKTLQNIMQIGNGIAIFLIVTFAFWAGQQYYHFATPTSRQHTSPPVPPSTETVEPTRQPTPVPEAMKQVRLEISVYGEADALSVVTNLEDVQDPYYGVTSPILDDSGNIYFSNGDVVKVYNIHTQETETLYTAVEDYSIYNLLWQEPKQTIHIYEKIHSSELRGEGTLTSFDLRSNETQVNSFIPTSGMYGGAYLVDEFNQKQVVRESLADGCGAVHNIFMLEGEQKKELFSFGVDCNPNPRMVGYIPALQSYLGANLGEDVEETLGHIRERYSNIWLYNLADGSKKDLFDLSQHVEERVSLLQRNEQLLALGDQKAYIFDLSGTLIREIDFAYPLGNHHFVSWIDDNQVIVIDHNRYAVEIADLTTGAIERVRTPHQLYFLAKYKGNIYFYRNR